MKRLGLLFLYVGLLFFSGCVATKDDIGFVQSKVTNVQDDFYATSKVIGERIKTLETNINENNSIFSNNIKILSEKNDRLSKNIEDLSNEKALLSTKISTMEEDIRKLIGKIDELDYKFAEEMKKENLVNQQKDFETRRDIKGLKETYNDIIISISSLSKNFSSIQGDVLEINQSQLKVADSLNKILSEVEKNSSQISQMEETTGKNFQIFIDELTRQESELYRLKTELSKTNSLPATYSENKNEEKTIKEETSSDRTKTYIVKKGDSIGVIASRFNTTSQAIKKLNNLQTDKIFVGQKLTIP
jgi:LysM repeat protein